jgi:hypothetical protein
MSIKLASAIAQVRAVLAVIEKDHHVALVAAELTRAHGARLTLIQCWRPPFLLWGLTQPSVLPVATTLGATRDRAVADLLLDTEQRLRALVRELDVAPCQYWSERGRPSTVAARAARTGDYDAIVFEARNQSRWSPSLRRLDVTVLTYKVYPRGAANIMLARLKS